MKNSVISMELRKLIVNLRNEDKLSIGDISKTVGKFKCVIHSILRKLEENVSCQTKKPTGRPKKTIAREEWWVDNESNKDRFATATAISKRANTNLGIKISMHTISRRLNEINLNSRVASTKSYISKKNKMNQLKITIEHITCTEEQWNCVHFSDVKFVMGEGLFNPVLRNDIRLSTIKAALNLKEYVW